MKRIIEVWRREVDELFITTAWNELTEAQRRQFPQSGDLFYLHTDITGAPRRYFAG